MNSKNFIIFISLMLATIQLIFPAYTIRVTTINTGSNSFPESVLADPVGNRLFVALHNAHASGATNGTIQVYNLATYGLATTFNCGNNTLVDPMGMALIGNHLFVANADVFGGAAGNIVRIDTMTGICSAGVPLQPRQNYYDLVSDGTDLWASSMNATRPGNLYRFTNLSNWPNPTRNTWPLADNAAGNGIVLGAGSDVWVADYSQNGRVRAYNRFTGVPGDFLDFAPVSAGAGVDGLAWAGEPGASDLYATTWSNIVHYYAPATRTYSTAITGLPGTADLDIDRINGRLYVADLNANGAIHVFRDPTATTTTTTTSTTTSTTTTSSTSTTTTTTRTTTSTVTTTTTTTTVTTSTTTTSSTSTSTTTTRMTTTTTTTLPAMYRRYFPKIVNDSAQTTGLAVVNLSAGAANLTLKAYSNSGTLLASSQLTLPARQQLARLVGEILPDLGNTAGWMMLESNVPNVEGFFLLFDLNLTVMDGAVVSENTLTSFLLPAGDDGEISLVNPSGTTALFTLEYVNEAGLAAAPLRSQIPAFGRTAVLSSAIGPVGSQNGYFRYAGGRVVPLAVIGNAGWMGALNGIDTGLQATAGSEQGPAARTLYAPQYAFGGGYASVLDLINLEETPASISLQWIADDGQQIGRTGSVTLPPRGSIRISNPSLFDITAGTNQLQGYVKMESARGRFDGWVRFTDPAGQKFGSVLRFVGEGQTTTYFSQVAQDNQYFTGLAVLNPNSTQASVQVTVYDTTGAELATGTQTIAPGGRFSKLLNQLVGNFPARSNGYFKIASTQPVAAIALFGTHLLEVLVAVPPQSPSGR